MENLKKKLKARNLTWRQTPRRDMHTCVKDRYRQQELFSPSYMEREKQSLRRLKNFLYAKTTREKAIGCFKKYRMHSLRAEGFGEIVGVDELPWKPEEWKKVFWRGKSLVLVADEQVYFESWEE